MAAKRVSITTGQAALIARVREAYEASKASRSFLEQAWKSDYAFFKGHQDGWAQSITSLLKNQKSKESDLVLNKIWGYVWRNATNLAIERPYPIVVPATAEDEDIQNAQNLSKAIESLWQGHDLDEKLLDASTIASIYGTGFVKIIWDDDEKDFEFDTLSPWEVFPDPRAKSMEDCRWVIQIKPMHVEDIKARFGVTVEAKDEVEWTEERDILGLRDVDQRAGDAVKNPTKPKDATGYVLLMEYWDKNQVIKVAGNHLLEVGEHAFGQLPFFAVYDFKEPKRIWGIGEPRMLRDLQIRYNKLGTQVVKNIEIMGNPKLLIEEGTRLSAAPVATYGQVIRWSGSEPRIMPGAPLPQEMFLAMNRISQLMDDVSLQFNVDPEALTKSNISGRFVEAFQNVANIPLRYKKFHLEKTLQKMGRLLLHMIQKKYTKDKVMKTVGANRDISFWRINGSMIQDGMDVYFSVHSNLPDSKIGKQDLYLQLVQAGIMQPTEARKLLGLEGILNDVDLSVMGLDKDPEQVIESAKKENESIAHGEMPQVIPRNNEDNEAHIKLHYAFLDSQLTKGSRPYRMMLSLIQREEKQRGDVQPVSRPSATPNPLGTGTTEGQPGAPGLPQPVAPQTAQGVPAPQPAPPPLNV